MIKWHCIAGDMGPSRQRSFEEVSTQLREGALRINDWKVSDLIAVLSELGRKVPSLKESKGVEGASYVSLWLRKENLSKQYGSALGTPCTLDGWVVKGGAKVMAQPRGLVCHWVASNVPTLGFFSWALASMSKCPSILKVSEVQASFLKAIIDKLSTIEVENEGKVIKGADLAACAAVVSFEGGDADLSASLSMVADVKVVWGGQAAIAAIAALPQKEWCETLVFGPKYSFAIFAQDAISSDDLSDRLRKAIIDAILFDQMACSSPHTFFFECGKEEFSAIVDNAEGILRALPRKLTGQAHAEHQCTKIITARGDHLLSLTKNVRSSKGLEWSLLIDDHLEIGLAEPIGGRCFNFRMVPSGSLMELPSLITRKIQAVILEVDDEELREKLAREITRHGADRITRAGQIHEFALPWDGTMALDRMVRFVSLR